jgi:preprotein translocase subunit SecE
LAETGRETIVVNKKESAELKQPTNEFKLAEYVNDIKEELSKVVWPSRQQLLSESAAVILMVSLVAVVIYLVDNFFSWGALKVFG